MPPTPGPLAAAAIVGADIGKTIIFGGIACLFGSLACWAWGVYVAGPRIKTLPSDEFEAANLADNAPDKLPSTLSSYTPIVIPIVLIATQSVVSLWFDEGHILRTLFLYLGWPVVALSIGVWLAYRNITTDDAKQKAKDEWVESALKTSAMILVITGLGGSLSAILRGTPAVDFIAAMFTDYGLPTDTASVCYRNYWQYDYRVDNRRGHHSSLTCRANVRQLRPFPRSGHAFWRLRLRNN